MKDMEKTTKDTKVIGLRVPIAMLEQINNAIKIRNVRLPRNIWILEAIDKQLNGY